MSGIIALDSQVIDSQQLRLAGYTKSNHEGFLRIIKALQKQLSSEKLLYLQAGTVRSKRRVVLARRQDIIDKIQYEIDTMSMSGLEASNLQTEFEQMRYHYARSLTDFVQYTEERLAVQKEKALIRMTGFAKNVIDDINEVAELPRNNKSHAIVHMLQTCTIQLAADGILPRNDHVESLFQHLDEGPIDPIVLFNALQLLDILCSQNWAHGKNLQIEEQRSIVHKLIKLIPYAFTFVRTWTDANCDRVTLFVVQLFQALKAALTILNSLGSVSAATLPPAQPSAHANSRPIRDFGGTSLSGAGGTTYGSLTFGHSVSTASNDHSSTPSEHPVHYFEWCDSSGSGASSSYYADNDLATDVTLWLKTFKYAKLGYFDATEAEHRSILSSFCTPELRVPAVLNRSEFREPPTVHAFVTKELSVLLSIGSTLVTHALQCAEMVTHILVSNQEKATLRAEATAVSANTAAASDGMQDSMLTTGTGLTASGVSQLPMRRMSSMLASLPQLGADTSGMRSGMGPPPIIPSIPAFGTQAHALLLAAMELGVLSTGRYAVRMGPQGCTAGIAFTHVRFLKAVDQEVGAALRCAMLSFSLGLPECVALSILLHGYDLAVHRWASYFFVLPWLHCTLAAVLWCIEKEIIPEEVHARGVQEMKNRLKRAETITSSAAAAPVSSVKASGAPFPVPGVLRSSVGQLGSLLPGVVTAAASSSSSGKMFSKVREPLSMLPKVVKAITTLNNNPLLGCPSTSRFCTRDEVVLHASEAALRILSVAAHLRHIMSAVHVSLLLVRLLLRDLFMRRMRIEELMETPLLTLLIPVLDLQAAQALEMTTKDSDDEREKEKLTEQSIQDLTVRTPESGLPTPEASLFENSVSSMPTTPLDAEESYMSGTSFFSKGSDAGGGGGGDGSRGGSRGGGSRSAVPLVPQYWKEWTATHLEKEFTDGEGYPSQRMNFVSFLQYVGETHLQSREVVEQLLLMVDHLIHKSQVCKFQLVDNGMPLVVQRILSGQTDNVYMMALSEMCSEDLELKI